MTDSIPMTSTPIDLAARDLADRRRAGRLGPGLAADARPADLAAGLALQRRVAALIGEPIGGWKCAMPVTGRTIVAPIFAPTIRRTSPTALRVRGGGVATIEPEVAFVLAHDLPPRERPYAEADVRAAISATHVVLELIGNRYTDPAAVTFPEMLADFVNNQGLYVGSKIDDGPNRALDRVAITIDTPTGRLMTLDGRHPDGHPLMPLSWLANFLPTQGDHLRAGQIVTTGSYAGAFDVPLDVPLVFVFGDLGTLAVELTALP
jgi:2-keto-4-pentenoate hydratase